jgi:hypothetical protein
MTSCTRRSYGGGLKESLRRAKSTLADLTNPKKPGASLNQIKVVQNQVNALQKQYNEKNALKGAQIMFQKANNNAAAAATHAIHATTQAVNAAKTVAVNLHKANQNLVTPNRVNTTAIAAVNNAKKAVSQYNTIVTLAKNAKKIANQLELLIPSGGKRRTRRTRRTRRIHRK